MCSILDSSKVRYQYTPIEGQDTITKNRCGSRCYAYNPITGEENTIRGFYKRQLTYFDQFNTDTQCPIDSTNYTANCSFKDCFYNADSNTYYKAIGIVPHDDMMGCIVQIEGVSYKSNYYFKLYQASYRDGDEKITLTEIENEKVCAGHILSNEYMADKVRVADQFAE